MDPTRLVEARVRVADGAICVRTDSGPVLLPTSPLLLAAGKAAVAMVRGLGSLPLAGGAVITTPGLCAAGLPVPCYEAGHPVPDRRGLDATASWLRMARRWHGPVLCLLSGGASSLLVRPRTGVPLAAKQRVTALLLASGAPIGDVNAVRKHLSLVKGGGLLRVAGGRPFVTLALSDVVGDDLATIGSGPTVADPTTFGDAVAVLRRHGLLEAVPAPVRRLLERGARGRIPETVKPGDPETRGVYAEVIGSNRTALRAVVRQARALGLHPVRKRSPLTGETRLAAVRWAAWLARLDVRKPGSPICAVAGGETTVTVRGPGKGGRNTEFALALAREIAGSRWVVLSAGTDGIDGPTDAAGAFVDGTTWARATAAGIDPEAMLQRNDSYRFFGRLGDLFVTGPTGTNVMDVKVAVRLQGR